MTAAAAAVPAAPALQTLSGRTAVEIAESVRELAERGLLSTGDTLPSVRALAEQLGINRNTVVAAYRQLAQAGIVNLTALSNFSWFIGAGLGFTVFTLLERRHPYIVQLDANDPDVNDGNSCDREAAR